MKPIGTVLVLSDTPGAWQKAAVTLTSLGHRLFRVVTEADALSRLADVKIDVLVAEADRETVASRLEFLGNLQGPGLDILCVLVCAPDVPIDLATIREAGVHQILRAPGDADQIALVIERGLEAREIARRHRLLARDIEVSGPANALGMPADDAPLAGEIRHFEKLVYVGEAMAELCALAREAARTSLPVLIQGEPGSGKELLARAVHYHSARREGAFIVRGCDAMEDGALAAALFAEGVSSARTAGGGGLLNAASGGTLFIDGVCNLSSASQAALLRLILACEGGGSRVPAVDIRVIAATTNPLADRVAEGAFRQDLYCRLRSFELDIPPLREREEDIPALAAFFMARYAAAMHRRILGMSTQVLEKLAAHAFPGNVRELESEIRRMVALARDGDYLTARMLSPALLASVERKHLASDSDFAPEGGTLKEKIESLEKHLVSEALARHRWNRSRVAEELGLSRVGLANKIKRYKLDGAPRRMV